MAVWSRHKRQLAHHTTSLLRYAKGNRIFFYAPYNFLVSKVLEYILTEDDTLVDHDMSINLFNPMKFISLTQSPGHVMFPISVWSGDFEGKCYPRITFKIMRCHV